MKKMQSLTADLSSKGMGVLILQNVLVDRSAQRILNVLNPLYFESLTPITLQRSVPKTVCNHPVYSL